ncbi:transglutaminase family protein [Kribbella sp. NPDC051718]|uniref:transglutaminase-like domain-containing protein n=1 Tax=Kribbella sp. NPDC051718 TaxID=3155168 RepID=UPI003447F437
MSEYLAEDDVIDHSHPAITSLAARLRAENPGTTDFARAAFDITRDEVKHSMDVADPVVTVTASEVLEQGTGLCFAKSHLLTALLRAEGVPAGLCYQKLSNGRGGHFLHGMVAVYLDGEWHRQDPRGDKPGVTTEFSLTDERLAYHPRDELGEADLEPILASPDPGLVAALRNADNTIELVLQDGLPADLATRDDLPRTAPPG